MRSVGPVRDGRPAASATFEQDGPAVAEARLELAVRYGLAHLDLGLVRLSLALAQDVVLRALFRFAVGVATEGGEAVPRAGRRRSRSALHSS